MKTGIIITFDNRERKINKKQIIQFLRENDNFHLCLVNNGGSDGTKAILEELEMELPNLVSVVNIKINKGMESAIRTGFRLLMHKEKVAQVSVLKDQDVKELDGILELSKKFNLQND